MFSLLLSMNLTISATIVFMKHPLSMGAILLIQTILVALIVGTLSVNFWFSYILTLIMIGGMLILFIYMTSIASNEKFKFNPLLTIYTMTVFSISLMTVIIDQYLANAKLNNPMVEEMNTISEFQMMMSKYINWPNNIMLYMTISYLFITLIAVVKITNIKQGPLRQTN
uniref:NADH-ubiquinone oxidoreductase chain 6 n=1 Tax=Temnoscheila virescens TaxID=1205670 RepID=A0A0S2MNZ3_9CUCU|nr:NADH deshydrogenase subunit 6 [Temnoscheila virescens]